jgi:hypothetical protein
LEEDHPDTVDSSKPTSLEVLMETDPLPYLTSSEQIHLALIVDCISEVEDISMRADPSSKGIDDHWMKMLRGISFSSDSMYYPGSGGPGRQVTVIFLSGTSFGPSTAILRYEWFLINF